MIWIVIAFISIVLIFSLFLKLNKKTGSSSHEHSYNKIDSLFTPAERSFLGVLNQAIDDNDQWGQRSMGSDSLLSHKLN